MRVVDLTVADETASRRQAAPLEAGPIGAPMPGQVLNLAVQVGDAVTVQELLVRQGEKVPSGDLLVVVG